MRHSNIHAICVERESGHVGSVSFDLLHPTANEYAVTASKVSPDLLRMLISYVQTSENDVLPKNLTTKGWDIEFKVFDSRKLQWVSDTLKHETPLLDNIEEPMEFNPVEQESDVDLGNG